MTLVSYALTCIVGLQSKYGFSTLLQKFSSRLRFFNQLKQQHFYNNSISINNMVDRCGCATTKTIYLFIYLYRSFVACVKGQKVGCYKERRFSAKARVAQIQTSCTNKLLIKHEYHEFITHLFLLYKDPWSQTVIASALKKCHIGPQKKKEENGKMIL